MNNIINYGSQKIDIKDIKFVTKALKQKLLTTGPLTDLFEYELKKKLKVKNAHVCNSGTSALYLSLKAIGIKKGDVVICPAVNFVASTNILKYLGAKIIFSDVDPINSQIRPDQIINCIKKNRLKKIKALIVMYMGGYPRYINEYLNLKKKYSFILIEDACHAFGASYNINNKNFFIGCCKHSDISTFSFHPLKTITTCEGGLITTNNKFFSNKIKLLRSHGIIKSKNYWKYDVVENGFNLRLSDVNSSLGVSQLKRVEAIIRFRKKIYKYYYKNLNKYNNVIKFVEPEANTNPSYHLVIAIIDFKILKISRDQLIKKMNKDKIFPQVHYIPIYKFKSFKNIKKTLKGSEKYYNSCISLPIHLNLKFRELDKVIKILKKIIDRCKKK
jgi:dTDP-4-amino-4,6-dideoxygalactose transaminase